MTILQPERVGTENVVVLVNIFSVVILIDSSGAGLEWIAREQ